MAKEPWDDPKYDNPIDVPSVPGQTSAQKRYTASTAKMIARDGGSAPAPKEPWDDPKYDASEVAPSRPIRAVFTDVPGETYSAKDLIGVTPKPVESTDKSASIATGLGLSMPAGIGSTSTDADRGATTATTPAARKEEQRRAAVARLQGTMSADSVDAFGYGAARAGTLNMVDRLVGAGTHLGEQAASVLPAFGGDTGPADPNAGAKARNAYLAREDEVRRDNESAYFGGNVLGSIPITMATGGAGLAGPEVSTAARFMTSPAGKLVAENFASGAFAERSDDPAKQIKSGATSTALGAVAMHLSDATLGKILDGAVGRQGKNIAREIRRGDEGVPATKTGFRLLEPKLEQAVREVSQDPVFRAAVRTDPVSAANMARSKAQVLSAPRDEMYQALNRAGGDVPLSQIEKEIDTAIKHSTGAPKNALESWRKELQDDYIPKWKEEGKLLKQSAGFGQGFTDDIMVHPLAVREWVTKAQSGAAKTVGAFKESEAKDAKKAMQQVAVDLWQGHLDGVAVRHPELVATLRNYDNRYSALKAMETVLDQRATAAKEAGWAQKAAKLSDVAAGSIGPALAFSHPLEAAAGVSGYLAMRQGPKAARAINDRVLVPLQLAAQSGKDWASFAKMAAEGGIPQSVARAVYNRAKVPAKEKDKK
jgi:hypothetical protein